MDRIPGLVGLLQEILVPGILDDLFDVIDPVLVGLLRFEPFALLVGYRKMYPARRHVLLLSTSPCRRLLATMTAATNDFNVLIFLFYISKVVIVPYQQERS